MQMIFLKIELHLNQINWSIWKPEPINQYNHIFIKYPNLVSKFITCIAAFKLLTCIQYSRMFRKNPITLSNKEKSNSTRDYLTNQFIS